MAGGGGCFLGASLSCTDILVYLYTSFLRIDPRRPEDPDRDYLLLSKGHDVPALYGVLADLGFFPAERLSRHLDPSDRIYWHPSCAIPGVEFHSGSLGHLLSVGAGIAWDLERSGGPGRVVVLLGDGELDEGSVWETSLVASALRLQRLTAVVDRNGFQANARTESLVPLEPLDAKFRAFGWGVSQADGHDWESLDRAFRPESPAAASPRVVIARTVRGKGIPSIESRIDRWFCRLSSSEVDSLLGELSGAEAREIAGEGLTVR
jgi:transketolase